MEGTNAADTAKALFDAGADIVGMNCLRPPQHMLGPMEEMRKAVSGYLACQPVGYRTPEKPDFTSLPEFPYALDPLQLTRARKWEITPCRRVRSGSNYIGSCCGSVASHVREMAKALGKLPPDNRIWKTDGAKPMSAFEYYDHDKETMRK